jgi:salicylate hydroxylase
MTGRVYAIAGAGISGLTLALALARSGDPVVVLEKQPALAEHGAGLQISPNAWRVLRSLGLDEELGKASFRPEGLDLYPAGGDRPLVTLELGAGIARRFGAPYAVMHRADLASLLEKGARRFANVDIRFGATVWTEGLAVDETGLHVPTQSLRAHALLGADGVHSETRRTLLGGPAAQFTGKIAWRSLLPFDMLGDAVALDRVSVFWGRDHHIVCYPLPHHRQLNVAAFLPGTAESETPPALASFRGRAAALFALGQNWTRWPLYTVQTPHWSQGPVGILGDAAHAMLPFQAQGAAMGIEDAAVLAPLLTSAQPAAEALLRYQALRQRRVRRVQQVSESNGRIFHLGFPLDRARNAVMLAGGPHSHWRRLHWLYSYDATQAA